MNAASRPLASERTPLQVLTSLAAAAGLVLLAPFAIILAGLPIVLIVWGLSEVVERLVAVLR